MALQVANSEGEGKVEGGIQTFRHLEIKLWFNGRHLQLDPSPSFVPTPPTCQIIELSVLGLIFCAPSTLIELASFSTKLLTKCTNTSMNGSGTTKEAHRNLFIYSTIFTVVVETNIIIDKARSCRVSEVRIKSYYTFRLTKFSLKSGKIKSRFALRRMTVILVLLISLGRLLIFLGTQ